LRVVKLIPPDEAARRARAAIAYAGLKNPEVAKRTGLKLGTLNNILSQTRPSGGSLDNLLKIARACDVPREFMEGGWSAVTAIHHGSNNLSERMQSLSEELHERMERLERELSQALLERAAGEVERAADTPDTSSSGSPAPSQGDPGQQGQQ
jgi:transcriptional regulator with XRE-family HTH domain